MATAQPVRKYTWEDYRATPPDTRYELLDGELLMTPSPKTAHQWTQNLLGRRLSQFVEEQGLGGFFFAPYDVVLSDTDVVQPDLLFVSRDRLPLVVNDDNLRGAPDLVVEILSPGTADRDLGYKRELYARHGVAEYWIVDPAAETIRVLRRRGGEGFAPPRTFGRGRILRSEILAGFELAVDAIFR